MKFSLSKL